MIVKISILGAILVFGIGLGVAFLKDKVSATKAVAFGLRWTVVGFYVAMATTIVKNSPEGGWEFAGFILAVVALAVLDFLLRWMVSTVED